jgi:hypothetical protein
MCLRVGLDKRDKSVARVVYHATNADLTSLRAVVVIVL